MDLSVWYEIAYPLIYSEDWMRDWKKQNKIRKTIRRSEVCTYIYFFQSTQQKQRRMMYRIYSICMKFLFNSTTTDVNFDDISIVARINESLELILEGVVDQVIQWPARITQIYNEGVELLTRCEIAYLLLDS